MIKLRSNVQVKLEYVTVCFHKNSERKRIPWEQFDIQGVTVSYRQYTTQGLLPVAKSTEYCKHNDKIPACYVVNHEVAAKTNPVID